MNKRDPKQKQDGRDELASHKSSDDQVSRRQPGQSRSESGQTDEDARRDPAQAHDYTGEAQNVSAGPEGRDLTGNGEATEHARNKALEGQKQNRDD